MTWKGGFDRGFTREEFTLYVAGLKWTGWRPQFVTVHNTGAPNLAQWKATKGGEAQRLKNLEHYYKNQKGWASGPHLFIGEKIWLGTPLTVSGTHSPSWNPVALAVEIAGDYDVDAFTDPIRGNAVHALAVLHQALGLSANTIRFHREDPATSHKRCPGKSIDKDDLIEAVRTGMLASAGGDHPAEPEGEDAAPQGLAHVAKMGDTLWAIAKRYGVPAAELVARNGGSTVLEVGQEIAIGEDGGLPDPQKPARLPADRFRVSRSGALFIIREEGIVLRVYPDGDVSAVGVGHNDATMVLGADYTLRQAMDFFDHDLGIVEAAIAKLVTVPISQEEGDALGSFAFNLGIGTLARASLTKKLNAGDYEGAADGLLAYHRAGGKPVEALLERRKRERDLFRLGIYGAIDVVSVWDIYPRKLRRVAAAELEGLRP